MRTPGPQDIVIAHTVSGGRAWLAGLGVDPREALVLAPSNDAVRGRRFTYDDVGGLRALGPVWSSSRAQDFWQAMFPAFEDVAVMDWLSRPWHDARLLDLHEIFATHRRVQGLTAALAEIKVRLDGPTTELRREVREIADAALDADRRAR